jgi:hypothetical protein
MILREAFYRDLPGERTKFDYGTRTDGNPVYMGHAKLGTPFEAPEWTVTFFKYDTSGNIDEGYCLKGIKWTDRAVLFLEYV